MAARIVCQALALRPGGTGVQTYIRSLLGALVDATDADLAAAVQADAVAELPAGVTPLVRPVGAGLGRALVGLRSLGPADLVHGLDVDLPARPGAPTVATVHDMAVFDVPWALSRRKAFGERWLYRQALARADVVIAVSAFTAERVRAWLGRDAIVVHEGAPDDLAPAAPAEVTAVRARYELPETFVVHVGTVEPRKDTPTLAAACRAAGLPLVLAGAVAPGQAVPAGARSLGYVPRSDLPGLYGAATAVGYPSRYEGFGLPPLEAMACGAPVVASAATALPEVLGDAAVLARPGDVDGWARALRDLADDGEHRAALVVAGGRRAAELTWKAAAEGTGAVYRSLGVPA